jgi:pyruvate/2-oxoglutarate dehydrogenase complex dihydrolipoamide acyltransferase (E2) component
MPALSPTMTEGNIAKWNVKEGDSFSAGDVLLEIETDKASMDVEAQDDGIIAKIIQGDGSKGIQVGTRIAVLAEPGDDLSALAIPAEDSPAKPSPTPEASNPVSQAEASPSPSSSVSAHSRAQKSSGPAKKQTYPLLPSVEHLMHENGLDASSIDKMTPTGPNNRLLKGDVLAYLGSIASSYPAELSGKIAKLSHLDLSNIKLAPPAPKPAVKPAVPIAEAVAQDVDVSISVSMKAVLEVQTRIQSTLGVFMPLSTFIARATDVANDDLPHSKAYKATADDLFNQVLGLDKVASEKGSRGNFLPQITALPGASPVASLKAPAKKSDIIDILSGKSKPSASISAIRKHAPGMSASVNVFSVTVPKEDEQRATIFLERVKGILEVEPGRLVL